jgi:hypothetical protein
MKFPVLFPVSREFRRAVWDEGFGAEIFLSISLSSIWVPAQGRQIVARSGIQTIVSIDLVLLLMIEIAL